MVYERRRDLRHRVDLAAHAAHVAQQGHGQTEDVSFRGLLVRATAKVTIGQLCLVVLELPDDAPIFLHTVPIRVSADRFAVRVLGSVPRWDRFVSTLQAASSQHVRVASPLVASGDAAIADLLLK